MSKESSHSIKETKVQRLPHLTNSVDVETSHDKSGSKILMSPQENMEVQVLTMATAYKLLI